MVYDCSKKSSFQALEKWKEELMSAGTRPECPIIVIGNKNDLPLEKKQVSLDEAVRWCEQNKVSVCTQFPTKEQREQGE